MCGFGAENHAGDRRDARHRRFAQIRQCTPRDQRFWPTARDRRAAHGQDDRTPRTRCQPRAEPGQGSAIAQRDRQRQDAERGLRPRQDRQQALRQVDRGHPQEQEDGQSDQPQGRHQDRRDRLGLL